MKAVILAAGIGSRLRPITNNKPKTLVKVNEKAMLEYIIDALCQSGINEIVVCTGFESVKIVNFCESKYPLLNFHFVKNAEFEDTNNMYSLFLARKHLNDDLIILNADLVFDSEIIKGLINQKCTSVAVDKGRYMEESMKIIVRNDVILNISKNISKKEAYGCSIDVYKINKADVNKLTLEMKRIIQDMGEKNQWTEVMLDNLFSSGNIVAKPFDIGSSRWYEIDNYTDLAEAEILFNDKIKELKNKKIFFIDRDGTITIGNNVILGAKEFLEKLKIKNKKFFIATNNSSKTPSEHLNSFNNLNLCINDKNILVSSLPAIEFLKLKKLRKIFWLANGSVSKYFTEEGLIFEEKKPQAILLTYDNEINYDKICKFTNFIRMGLPYYATHSDIVCPTEEGSIPDIGSFIKIFEMTTGMLPNKIFGKPDKSFIGPILNKYKLNYKDAVIIGDRLYTDIKMAENSEITSILVLSGETKRENYENSKTRSDIVVSDLGRLTEYL